MKQSSVEWLALKIIGMGLTISGSEFDEIREYVDSAKAMHEKEYIDAWMNGQNDSGYSQKELRQMAEADYNETFNNGEETK